MSRGDRPLWGATADGNGVKRKREMNLVTSLAVDTNQVVPETNS